MMGYTHVLVGLAAGMGVAASVGAKPADSLVLAGLGGLAALLPDIDHPKSEIRRKMGIMGRIGLFWLSHRGITHTWLALVIVGAVATLFLPSPLALAILAGYASHLIADMATVSGLPVFWPLSESKFYVLPRPVRFRTGSLAEKLLNIGLMGLLVWVGYPVFN